MTKRTRSLGAVASLSILGALCAGCATSALDQSWGTVTQQHRQAMTENPRAAEERAQSHQGLDPTTGELVIETYKRRQTEERSDPAQLFLISQ